MDVVTHSLFGFSTGKRNQDSPTDLMNYPEVRADQNLRAAVVQNIQRINERGQTLWPDRVSAMEGVLQCFYYDALHNSEFGRFIRADL